MARGTSKVPAPRLDLGIAPAVRDQLQLFAKAMAGDMLFVVNPATDTPLSTAAAWEKTFYVELQSAAGEVHSWFNDAIASGVAVGDTGGGTATIPSTTLTFVDGVAEVVVSGDAATWAAGETVTITVAQATVLGYTIAQKTGVITFSGTSRSPSISPSRSPSVSPSKSPSASPSA